MRFDIPSPEDVGYREYLRLFEQLERSAVRLDAQYRIPFTRIYIGWDAILGLLPIVGDLISATFSARIIQQAHKLGADAWLIRRMAANVLIDLMFGAVPIIGTFFDVWYRANMRNLRLLVQAMSAHRQRQTAGI